ncbi:MAG: hypothetical protein Q4E45_03540 [Eubacteriales bacterium]|nr:hypothetical protein [Eubacteriales bacterium]
MKKRVRFLTAALLLAALLTGCSGAGAPSAAAPTSAPAQAPTESAQPAASAAQPTAETAGNELPPTPPASAPDKRGYEEYADRFFRVLKKGDAFAASSYIWFENEEDRALWMDRFTAPYNASLKPLESLSLNLWAATVEEELGAGVPPAQTVYYVAWYDGSYRIFTDAASLPADLLRDRDYSGMPLPEEEKTDGGKRTEPGEDEFPPEDGQAEKWYREQQAELAAVKAAAERAVRALPEAKTVTSFDDPTVKLVEAAKLDFIKIEPMGSKLLVYAVSYPTTADEILGPITVYLDSEANVLGVAPRE